MVTMHIILKYYAHACITCIRTGAYIPLYAPACKYTDVIHAVAFLGRGVQSMRKCAHAQITRLSLTRHYVRKYLCVLFTRIPLVLSGATSHLALDAQIPSGSDT